MNAFLTGALKIRNCKVDDFDAVVPLLRQLYPDKSFDLVSLRRAYDRSLASDERVLFCAIFHQQMVGFGSLAIKSNLLWCETLIGYVNDMVVDEAYRGQGIGTQILDHIISWAREQGCHRIELNSSFHRKASHAFYEHRGFKRGAYFYSKLL
jgi:GNAT superfamily N-acetyltransferase